MSKALQSLRRVFPQIRHEMVFGELSGRWMRGENNNTRNQPGSVVFTDQAVYVLKSQPFRNLPDAARVPMGSAQVQIKSNAPIDRRTATFYLDVVPDAENQTRWLEAVKANDLATIRQVRTAGYRLAILAKEADSLSRLVRQARNSWENYHEWREFGFESRTEMDRALKAGGSPIGFKPESQIVASGIQQDGLSPQEAQSRVLTGRKGATSTRSEAAPAQAASDTQPKDFGPELDHAFPTDGDPRVSTSHPRGAGVRPRKSHSSRAGHWPQRTERGLPQVTIGVWLWAPGLDDWESAVLTATVWPANSPRGMEDFDLVIDLGDSYESANPRTVWMFERTDLESDFPIYELRARGFFGISDGDLYHCLVSAQSPWLGDLCRYVEGSWTMRRRNPRGPAEFDALPQLKWDQPDETDESRRPIHEQGTMAEESLRPHDDHWCSVREANILLGLDRVCPGCGSVIDR